MVICLFTGASISVSHFLIKKTSISVSQFIVKTSCSDLIHNYMMEDFLFVLLSNLLFLSIFPCLILGQANNLFGIFVFQQLCRHPRIKVVLAKSHQQFDEPFPFWVYLDIYTAYMIRKDFVFLVSIRVRHGWTLILFSSFLSLVLSREEPCHRSHFRRRKLPRWKLNDYLYAFS